ncbi:MAG: DUF4920 domain-containing protein [Gemmatimonadetes bacterium]|nr:DUF4920 domain-containing protein [Gemmatimonadota bacterium]
MTRRHRFLDYMVWVYGLSWVFCASALAENGKMYGDGIGEGASVAISKLYDAPDEHLGKAVQIAGRVVKVCQHRGCWIEIASDREFESMIVKVEDGVITFPVDATGKWAIAEGVFSKTVLDMEQTLKHEEHQCAEEGREFDPSTVTEAKVLYRIKGTGALIDDKTQAPKAADS